MPHFHDVLCFTHQRWRTSTRMQALLGRCARHRRVYVFEEPVTDEGPSRLTVEHHDDGVVVATPSLPDDAPTDVAEAFQRWLLDELVERDRLDRIVLWYHSPMPLAFTHHLPAAAVVYESVDELRDLSGAPLARIAREQLLLGHADVVFAATASLYERARGAHARVYHVPTVRTGDALEDAAAWDRTWEEMWARVDACVRVTEPRTTAPRGAAARAG